MLDGVSGRLHVSRRSAVTVVLTFALAGFGPRNAAWRGSQLRKGEAWKHMVQILEKDKTQTTHRVGEITTAKYYIRAFFWLSEEPPSFSAPWLTLTLLFSPLSAAFLLILWHIKGVTASRIKASAAQSVLYCSISFCRHTRDSHRHREKRRRRRGRGGCDEEYESSGREDD